MKTIRVSALAAIWLMLGAVCAVAQCPEFLTVSGAAAADYLGVAVAGAGDVDNDGVRDIIVGASGSDVPGLDAGQAFVYSGLTGALIHTFDGESAGDEFGRAVAGAGDVNSDGFDDVIIGAYLNGAGGVDAGRAYVFSGQDASLLYTLTGAATGDQFGWSVAGVGNANGDGYDDFAVGAPFNDAAAGDAGQVIVYSGLNGSVLLTLNGAAGGDLFGFAVGGAGDVNSDGFDDVIVGATENDAGGNAAGRAYVHSGQTGAVLQTVTGLVGGDRLGYSVDGVGDVNGDGFGDFLAGAPQNNAGGADAGQAYLYSGLTGVALHTFTGEAAGDWFGVSVAGAGDVNADASGDVIIGARYNDGAGSNAGKAYVYSGATGAFMFFVLGEQSLDEFGFSVDGAGDVDGDGFADLLVGGYLHDAAGDDAGRAYIFNCLDTDHDGIVDDFDNCPEVYNPLQADGDADGRGDVCDNCPVDFNPDQLDSDLDNQGDVCDPCPLDPLDDQDNDGFCADVDNCPTISNPSQANNDGDVLGDACDPDDDNDGIADAADNCPLDPNPGQENADGDLTGDVCDLCTDTDGDGFGNPGFPANTCPDDNCPTLANPSQTDTDADGIGDLCDPCPFDPQNDQDGDGVCGDIDNCPLIPNPLQTNTDGDTMGDECDPDDDDDGVLDGIDNCPLVINPLQSNNDGDLLGDDCDPDDDNDGVLDGIDNCQFDPNTDQLDLDQDGIGDICDPCVCARQADLDANTFVDAVDLAFVIDIVFFGASDAQDPACPRTRADFDANGFADAVDLAFLIDHVFFGQAGPCDPCNPVQPTCTP
ncbi:MAG: thrombospondin type 3 repeat-containing protein [Candidatus Zixiibacteriota bacterium]